LITLTPSLILRAISPPGEYPGWPVVVIVVGLLGLDVSVDSSGDRLICAPGLVLVDHGPALAVVPHQIPQARAAGRTGRERFTNCAECL
jgi:hypothetical protein